MRPIQMTLLATFVTVLILAALWANSFAPMLPD